MLKNSFGFSLIEILIGVALIGGIALSASQIFKQQNEGLKYQQLVAELDTYHADLRRIIQDVNNCNASFGVDDLHHPVNIGELTSSLNLCCPNGLPCAIDPLTNPCSRMVDQRLALNTNIHAHLSTGDTILNNSFTVLRWDFKDYSTGNNVPWIQNTTSGKVIRRVDLRVHYRMNHNLAGPKDFIKVIPLGFHFAGPKFQGCMTQESSAKNSLVKEICEGLNAQTRNKKLANWFENEAVERCEWLDTTASHTCPSGQVFLGINSLGDKICNPASYHLNENDLLENSEEHCPTGTIPQLLDNGTEIYLNCGVFP
jgi:prepilin-type N-terminal cleavage/methylation domain-containing protein